MSWTTAGAAASTATCLLRAANLRAATARGSPPTWRSPACRTGSTRSCLRSATARASACREPAKSSWSTCPQCSRSGQRRKSPLGAPCISGSPPTSPSTLAAPTTRRVTRCTAGSRPPTREVTVNHPRASRTAREPSSTPSPGLPTSSL